MKALAISRCFITQFCQEIYKDILKKKRRKLVYMVDYMDRIPQNTTLPPEREKIFFLTSINAKHPIVAQFILIKTA